MKLSEVRTMQDELTTTLEDEWYMIDEYMPKTKVLLPLGKKVLIECFPDEETYKTDSGIVLYKAPSAQEDVKPCVGRIIACGKDVDEPWILGRVVYFGTHAGARFVVDGVVYKVMLEADLYVCDERSFPTE